MYQQSVFTKMFKSFMLITTISVISLAFIMNYFLNDYFITQKEQALLEQCEIIQEQFTLVDNSVLNLTFTDQLYDELSALDKYLKARLWIINKQGNIFIDSNAKDSDSLGMNVDYHEIQSIFKGNTIKIQDYSNRYFKEPVLIIGYPLKSKSGVELALLVHAPLPEIKKTSKDVFMVSLIILIIIFLISSSVILTIGNRFKRELYHIILILKKIAKGDFSERIITNRQDELGELSQHINYMANELNSIENGRKTFIENISHDLRSPLTSISGYSKAILDHTISINDQDHYLKIINTESLRLTNLANSLISLTNFESIDIIEKSEFNLDSLLINTLDSFEQKIKIKNLSVDICLSDEKYLAIGVPEQIKRVLYNLIDNAIKFSFENSILKLWVDCNKKNYTVHIQNKGTSISEEKLNQIWNRFYKADSSRGSHKTGYGLGLSIVREIIKNHDEQIFVESLNNGLTIFSFTLQHTITKTKR